jgi:hypothetical protein
MDKKRIIIALSIAAVLIPLFCFVPSNSPVGLIGLMLFAGFGTWEFYGLLEAGNMPVSKKWGTTSGLLFIAATWFHMTGSLSNNMLWCILLLVVVSNFSEFLPIRTYVKVWKAVPVRSSVWSMCLYSGVSWCASISAAI